jgi:hypothetical protein
MTSLHISVGIHLVCFEGGACESQQTDQPPSTIRWYRLPTYNSRAYTLSAGKETTSGLAMPWPQAVSDAAKHTAHAATRVEEKAKDTVRPDCSGALTHQGPVAAVKRTKALPTPPGLLCLSFTSPCLPTARVCGSGHEGRGRNCNTHWYARFLLCRLCCF